MIFNHCYSAIGLYSFYQNYELECDGDTLVPKLITSSTPTGWYKTADNINYGSGGLTGHWWKELYLEFEFEETVSICGTTTDYALQPYTIKVDDQEITSATGSYVFGRNIETKKNKSRVGKN